MRGAHRVRITTLLLGCAFALSLVLALASIAGLVARRGGLVLHSRASAGGTTSFVVADQNALRLVRQHMTATAPGVTVNAGRLDTFVVTATKDSTPLVIRTGQNQLSVTGTVEMKFSAVPLTHGRLGVRWGTYAIPAGGVPALQFGARSDNVTVSYWTLLAAAGVGMGLTSIPLARRRRRRRRIARRLCATCGYDLRASPERCPECGTATPDVPAAA